MQPAETKKSILATLAYHDLLNHPLTAWEIFRYRILTEELRGSQEIERLGYGVILEQLTLLTKEERIDEYNGYYFLHGRETLYEERIERMKYAEEKWQSAKRVLK